AAVRAGGRPGGAGRPAGLPGVAAVLSAAALALGGVAGRRLGPTAAPAGALADGRLHHPGRGGGPPRAPGAKLVPELLRGVHLVLHVIVVLVQQDHLVDDRPGLVLLALVRELPRGVQARPEQLAALGLLVRGTGRLGVLLLRPARGQQQPGAIAAVLLILQLQRLPPPRRHRRVAELLVAQGLDGQGLRLGVGLAVLALADVVHLRQQRPQALVGRLQVV